MVLLREILADQTKTLLAHTTTTQRELKQEIWADMQATQGDLKKEIRQDIRREISQGQEAMKKEIQADLNREILALSKSCTTQFQDLQQGMQATERGIQDMRAAQGNMETRLQALEARGSDTATTASAPAPGKKPALVLGGWDPDTAAETMLELAKTYIRELRLDVDVERLFVPGVRRGFAILPYATRPGESNLEMRQRLQAALAKVRAANTVIPGMTRPVWMVYSRSPAERRRSALAGKVKRLVLQLQGDSRGGPGTGGGMGVWHGLAGRNARGQRSVHGPTPCRLSLNGRLD